MKKKTRSERKRHMKMKSVIAAAEETGEDVQEALKRAGLVPEHQRSAEKHDDEKKEPSDKARKRVEMLKMRKKMMTRRVEELEGVPTAEKAGMMSGADVAERNERKKKIRDHPAGATPEEQSRWLWQHYSGSIGAHGVSGGSEDRLRSSCGMTPSHIYTTGEGVTIQSIEQVLKEAEPGWERRFATPPVSPTADPVALFISPSAIGALDFIKHCPGFHSGCRIAKLFSKHIKIHEQAQYLKENGITMVTGTPNRLLKLCTDGHLDCTSLAWMIIDARRNPKSMTIVDLPEIAGDLWSLWDCVFSKSSDPAPRSKQIPEAGEQPKNTTTIRILLVLD